MKLHVLQSRPCVHACKECSRRSPRQHCDTHAPCPGYGTTPNCPPLIVLAVQECIDLRLIDLIHMRPAHA